MIVKCTVRLNVEDDWDEVLEMEVESFDEFLNKLGVSKDEFKESVNMGLCKILEPKNILNAI